MKYCWSIVLLILLSCAGKKENFEQPRSLEENAQFDLTKLTFEEDVKALMSKVIDTFESDYSFSNPPTIAIVDAPAIAQGGYITFDEKRYYFKSFERDSMAQFFGLKASLVEIETDSDLNILTCWATAKVFDSIELNAALHDMYRTYGKTNWMKKYESELGMQRVVYAHTDENGQVTHEVKYQEYNNIDYEAYLYEYHLSSDYYKQWNLPDRMIQINITNGTESIVDLTSGNYENKPYYRIEFLSIRKSEFDLITQFLRLKSTAENYPLRIVKSYYLRELDFYTNFDKYYISETPDGVKKYDFTR
ncbi:hypothetical protein GCM10009117_13190 [Gangjinia marincola]|uniref:Lipoprotein n=1 Tax=Gangjinia marincola TaxID=578463 RepID=A0ABN1MH46_9FLAO